MSTGCLHVVLSDADQIRRISWKVLLEQLWRRYFPRGRGEHETVQRSLTLQRRLNYSWLTPPPNTFQYAATLKCNLVNRIFQKEKAGKNYFKELMTRSFAFPLSPWIIYSYNSVPLKLWFNPINLSDGTNKSICLDECLPGSNLAPPRAAVQTDCTRCRTEII